MPGPMGRRNRGPAQKVENSGQVLKRLFGIIFKKYKIQMIIVFVCILISVLANVQGSLFIQNLIDDYIEVSMPNVTVLSLRLRINWI